MTMGMPKVLGFHNWEAIKTDYCSGNLSSKELARKWNVAEKTIRSRASRGEWPTPARFKQTMDKAMQIANDAVMQGIMGSEELGSPEEVAMKGLQPLQLSVHESLQHPAAAAKTFDALTYQQTMAEFACRKVAAGFARMKPPANWREMSVADGLARRALGLDAKGGGGGTTMIRISGQAGTVDVATTNPVDVGGDYEDADGDDWDE